MKKLFRYLIYTLGVLLLLVVLALAYITFFLPDVGPPPEIQVELTDEKVHHGRHLAHHVMMCMDCHAVRDFSQFSGPPTPGTLGAGGEVFDQSMGLPGRFVSPNITPAALNDWTDGEIFRAIVSGVSKDGSALFPIMPYPLYSQLDEKDIRAVIAYLRSIEPIENDLEASKPDFPVNFLINTMPVEANLQLRPPSDDIIEYGRYLTTASACTDCHTRMERGEFVGEPFAGGNEYRFPDGSVVRAPNLTPHESGIGDMTKDQFLARFKAYYDTTYSAREVEPGEFQTVMPWVMYAGMKEEELEAIYTYLQSLPAVENEVEIFSPPGD